MIITKDRIIHISKVKPIPVSYNWEPRTYNSCVLEMYADMFGDRAVENPLSLFFFIKSNIVISKIYHEKSKKNTFLMRENVDTNTIYDLLENPKLHTGQGKYITNDYFKELAAQELHKP